MCLCSGIAFLCVFFVFCESSGWFESIYLFEVVSNLFVVIFGSFCGVAVATPIARQGTSSTKKSHTIRIKE